MGDRAPASDRRRPRIAYLSFGSGEYDARTFRMARSAIAAGYEVTVYARWYPALPVIEERDGYRIIRAPFDWRLATPGLRGRARRRVATAMAGPVEAKDPADDAEDWAARDEGTLVGDPGRNDGSSVGQAAARSRGILERPLRLAWRVRQRITRPFRRWRRLIKFFPLYPLGWAAALEASAEPADIWHGMWAGSLPALARLRRRHGGRSIYDSRDVYMQSRDFATAGWPGKAILEWLERRWAHEADRVLTVNASYADLLAEQLRIPVPPVVMNCPERWSPPDPRPNLIRETLGLAPDVAVVLYQGGLMSGRGIAQAMDAILEVPGAVLCLMGFGRLRQQLAEDTSTPRYAGRVMMLDPVSPEALLRWTASADVSVMAIQPTSVNHRFTTPQKLFESVAAGVPVVASDLPGMADIVRSSGVGLVCDPTSPTAIAAAIREIISAPAEARDRQRDHVLRVAHERYNWETQVDTLLRLYRELL